MLDIKMLFLNFLNPRPGKHFVRGNGTHSDVGVSFFAKSTTAASDLPPIVTAAMQDNVNVLLIIGAALSAIAALLHFACIFLGAPAFRALGAGDKIARLAERGHWYANTIAFSIGAMLSVCAAYALSAAGLLPRFPLLRTVLSLFTAALFLRAIAFPLLRPSFPENSATFWWVSSSACLGTALVHAIGLSQIWTAG